MTTFIGLIRGINVGGKAILPMAVLRDVLTEIGTVSPRTLMQSGNFVCKAEGSASELEQTLEEALGAKLDKTFGVLVRTLEQWEAVLAANPFPSEAIEDPSHLLIFTCNSPLSKDDAQTVSAACEEPERVLEIGDTLFAYLGNGVADNKISKHPIMRTFLKNATGRNWNTACKLRDLANQL